MISIVLWCELAAYLQCVGGIGQRLGHTRQRDVLRLQQAEHGRPGAGLVVPVPRGGRGRGGAQAGPGLRPRPHARPREAPHGAHLRTVPAQQLGRRRHDGGGRRGRSRVRVERCRRSPCEEHERVHDDRQVAAVVGIGGRAHKGQGKGLVPDGSIHIVALRQGDDAYAKKAHIQCLIASSWRNRTQKYSAPKVGFAYR